MKYKSATAFEQALNDHLRRAARGSNQQHQWLRQLIAFERLLARLTEFAPERWILKGGLALDLRLGDRARTTKDVDLAWRETQEAAEAAFRRIETSRPNDYFTFQITRTSILDEADVAGTIRYRVICRLGGRTFTSFLLDLNFEGPILNDPDDLVGPTLLAFSDIPPVTVPVLALSQHIAEKVHAYTRQYGGQGNPSSRVKDLVDLVLIQASEAVVARDIRDALRGVFSTRYAHALPDRLPPPPGTWPEQYRRMAASLDIPTDLETGFRLAAAFLDPVLTEKADDAQVWSPKQGAWVNPREGAMSVTERTAGVFSEAGAAMTTALTPAEEQEAFEVGMAADAERGTAT